MHAFHAMPWRAMIGRWSRRSGALSVATMAARARWFTYGALALIAVIVATRAAAADITVEATVGSPDVVYNQAFILTIAIEGAQNVSPPSLYELDAFDVSYLGPSTQISFVNGRMSASISHRYRMV